MRSLAKTVYLTVHQAKYSVEELADRVGCSASMLYRASNPEDQEVDIKLRWLIPLMEATKDYRLLRHLASRLGFILVKIPRARRMKPEELAKHNAVLAEYQLALAKYVSGDLEPEQVHKLVDQALEQVARAKKMVQADKAQAELPLGR